MTLPQLTRNPTNYTMKPDTLPYLLKFQSWRRGEYNLTMEDAGITPALTTAALNDAIAELEKAAHVRAEIKAVLTENAHLADGTDCTLARLKAIVPEWSAEFNASDNF